MKKCFLLAAILLFVPSCSQSMKFMNDRDLYNSTDWNKNYYSYKDEAFVDKKENKHILNKKEDLVFTSWRDPNFKTLYGKDISYVDFRLNYGYENSLDQQGETFKLGHVSKLFDGKMFCDGSFELARVQINESGFYNKFSLKCQDYSYFAMNFRSDLDFKTDDKVYPHLSSFTVNVSFLIEDKIETYSYRFIDEGTNADNYIFFGFSLKNIDIKNCNGIGISYSDLVDEYNDTHEEKKAHCLMLYEILLPKSTWC